MSTSKPTDSKNEKKELQFPQILKLDDDYSLIQRFIEGDETCFKNLVHKHKEKVRNIIYLTLSSTDSVDDIAQEVFITVYKNLKSFRFESLFTTWLYRITINKCLDHIRKVKIRSIFTPMKEDHENFYESQTVYSDVPEIMHKAIKRLPEKLRTPLLLKDIEGLSYQEIAETVQCEIGTVKSRIFRAREGLKNILKPLEQELKG